MFPSITWKVKTPDKAVYLTFDDGPHPEITPWVLGELYKFNAKATFFCVGENVVKYPNVIKKILENGHAVGNHSFNHLKGWKTPNKVYFDNIEHCAQVLPSTLFRPPYGRITLSQFYQLKKKYQIVMWNILTRDYDANLDADEAFKKIIKYIGKGSVIVFHDSIKAKKNLKILLPKVLMYLNNNGYEMKSL
jgi:peptidoglycan/xylan/chitin deacetylase (PgdA/CDA1 family)